MGKLLGLEPICKPYKASKGVKPIYGTIVLKDCGENTLGCSHKVGPKSLSIFFSGTGVKGLGDNSRVIDGRLVLKSGLYAENIAYNLNLVSTIFVVLSKLFEIGI